MSAQFRTRQLTSTDQGANALVSLRGPPFIVTPGEPAPDRGHWHGGSLVDEPLSTTSFGADGVENTRVAWYRCRMRGPIVVAVLVVVGCSDSKSASPSVRPAAEAPLQARPPSEEADALPPRPRSPKVTRPPRVGEQLEWNVPRPQLDGRVSGFVTKDPSARELDRCELTGWSYGGCWVVYPTQGRVWTKFECEHVIDDDQRTQMCNNYASHLAVGDGGPPDRKQALEILEAGCEAGHKVTCVSIAELLVWEDVEGARRYAAKACAGDPDKNPIWCRDELVAPRRFEVAVTEVSGLEGITRATACELGVVDRGGSCRVRFACGDRVLYGAFGGTAPCTATAGGFEGGEAMTSTEDNDPAIELGTKTVHVYDDASATKPAFHIRGTLTAR